MKYKKNLLNLKKTKTFPPKPRFFQPCFLASLASAAKSVLQTSDLSGQG